MIVVGSVWHHSAESLAFVLKQSVTLTLISKIRKSTTIKTNNLLLLNIVLDDERINFKKHIECAATKAPSIAEPTSKILLNGQDSVDDFLFQG